ncbi:hypothetical protein TARUN_8174 [Trichoderma arundinaceum]|uniref:Uncharacterized protein n=1 Tax=Trichoderma arundinaceum TaxID=490622 RepID=A0A395NDN6_TRIAR|nr:hypothetical protein TARUN_8174 [Trichoderma arundinaceum]
MPPIDEPSSSTIGYQEKLPETNHYDHQQGHDATSIIPRWAPAIPDVPSLSSPLACVAESIYACCNFGWQHPIGYQPLPGPATVVYDAPQQHTMEVVPPSMTAQTIPSLQPLVQPLVPGVGGFSQHTPLASDQLNLDPLPLDTYPVLSQPSLPTLPQPELQPILQEPSPISNVSDNPYLLNQRCHGCSGQLATSELYNFPMASAMAPATIPAIVPAMVPAMVPMPSVHGGPMGQTISPLQYGPAPLLPPAHPPLVNVETTPSQVYNHYNISPAQNLPQPAHVETRSNPVGQSQDSNLDNYQRNVPGYEWSRRWAKSNSDPIQQWASSEVKVIYISVYFSDRYLPLKVRQFVPQDGDKLERTWDYQGIKKSVEIPPYALIDLEAGKSAYTKYIRDSMTDIFRNMLGDSDNLLYKTYLQAWHIWKDPETPTESFDLLNWTLRLWIAVRLSTTSAFIAGRETLGMSPNILDQTSPDPGKIPLPPVLGAQMDMILIHHIQTKLRHELLDNLQKVMLRNKPSSWLVTYLVTFILLHNVALITKHDAAYARKHGMRRRFAREGKVQEYHLAHFHYCNKGITPFSEACEDQDLRTLAHLDEDKIRFVRATRAYVQRHSKSPIPGLHSPSPSPGDQILGPALMHGWPLIEDDWERIRANGEYEKDYFFVSQLFDEKWQPRSTML